jgi:hypothetical protein
MGRRRGAVTMTVEASTARRMGMERWNQSMERRRGMKGMPTMTFIGRDDGGSEDDRPAVEN